MDRIKIILEKYKNQEIGYDQVIEQLNLPAFDDLGFAKVDHARSCLLYTSPSPRDGLVSRMPSSG